MSSLLSCGVPCVILDGTNCHAICEQHQGDQLEPIQPGKKLVIQADVCSVGASETSCVYYSVKSYYKDKTLINHYDGNSTKEVSAAVTGMLRNGGDLELTLDPRGVSKAVRPGYINIFPDAKSIDSMRALLQVDVAVLNGSKLTIKNAPTTLDPKIVPGTALACFIQNSGWGPRYPVAGFKVGRSWTHLCGELSGYGGGDYKSTRFYPETAYITVGLYANYVNNPTNDTVPASLAVSNFQYAWV